MNQKKPLPIMLTLFLALIAAITMFFGALLIMNIFEPVRMDPAVLFTDNAREIRLCTDGLPNPQVKDLQITFNTDEAKSSFNFKTARENGFYYGAIFPSEEIIVETESALIIDELKNSLGKIKYVLFIPDENGQFTSFGLEDENGHKMHFVLSENGCTNFRASMLRTPFSAQPTHNG